MASSVVLWAIYLEDKDSSQGMRKSIGIRAEKGRTRSIIESCSSPWQFHKGCEILQRLQNFTTLAKFHRVVNFRRFAAPVNFSRAANFRSLQNCLRKFPATIDFSYYF